VVDWGDGCQYQGSFFGFVPQGLGVFRYDSNASDQNSDEVVDGCFIEGCFLNNMVRRRALHTRAARCDGVPPPPMRLAPDCVRERLPPARGVRAADTTAWACGGSPPTYPHRAPRRAAPHIPFRALREAARTLTAVAA
jgi:hypothetical protein